MDHSLEDICRELTGLKRVIVSTHVNPDPDAIGSSAALCHALAAAGAVVSLHLSKPVPKWLAFLTDGIDVVSEVPNEEISAFVALDTATRERVGGDVDLLMERAAKSINIDHHYSNPRWADWNLIDEQAASSAQIALDVIEGLKVKVSESMARAMFAGLMDDTGSFRFSNTDERALNNAAALVGYGANPAAIANHLYFSIPERRLRLQADVLSGVRLVADGRIAIVAVDEATLKRCKATVDDTEGLVDYARSLEGTLAAVFLLEQDGKWKGSLRSKQESLDVSQIASAFGGGGHKMAAGFRSRLPREELEAEIVSKLIAALDRIS